MLVSFHVPCPPAAPHPTFHGSPCALMSPSLCPCAHKSHIPMPMSPRQHVPCPHPHVPHPHSHSPCPQVPCVPPRPCPQAPCPLSPESDSLAFPCPSCCCPLPSWSPLDASSLSTVGGCSPADPHHLYVPKASHSSELCLGTSLSASASTLALHRPGSCCNSLKSSDRHRARLPSPSSSLGGGVAGMAKGCQTHQALQGDPPAVVALRVGSEGVAILLLLLGCFL